MGKKLYENLSAEAEADEVGARFMDSADVVGDMSRAFGHDFSGVNIHADSVGASRVAGTGVDAIAEGSDIYFGSGVYQKGDPASNGLLAHELTHTMQQGAVGGGGAGAEVSSPMGAAQGGIKDWFRKLFHRKGPEISGPTNVQRDRSKNSVDYLNAMRAAGVEVGQKVENVSGRLQAPQIGQMGTAEDLAELRESILGTPGEDGTRSGGSIELSNRSYRSGKGLAETLVNLNIRNSGTATGKAERKYIGSLLNGPDSGYNKNIGAYFDKLEEGGVDMDEVANSSHMVKVNDLSKYFTGGGQDQINQDMLTMAGNYLTSKPGLEYYKNVSDSIKDADVFKAHPEELDKYMMKTLLTKTGSSSIQFKDPGKKSAALNGTRSIMALPNLADENYDQSQIPATMLPLVQQYKDLVKRIQEELGKM